MTTKIGKITSDGCKMSIERVRISKGRCKLIAETHKTMRGITMKKNRY